MSDLAQAVLRAADVVIATLVQEEMDLLKKITFEQDIIDEISIGTHGELLCCWRGGETLTLIGDTKQLSTTTLTTASQNPFANVLSNGPFQRWTDLGMRVFLLTEFMRMTAGLEDICNTIFYSSKLVRGPGTSLDDPNRKLSQDLSNIAKAFPILTREPEGLVYPIFFDVRGHCIQEPNGSSRVNGYNISFIIAWIKRLLKQIDLGLTASDRL